MPNKINKNTLIPEELADMIEEEIKAAVNDGVPTLRDVRLGIKTGVDKWKKKAAGKSGG
jgi:hypothetical protein